MPNCASLIRTASRGAFIARSCTMRRAGSISIGPTRVTPPPRMIMWIENMNGVDQPNAESFTRPGEDSSCQWYACLGCACYSTGVDAQGFHCPAEILLLIQRLGVGVLAGDRYLVWHGSNVF